MKKSILLLFELISDYCYFLWHVQLKKYLTKNELFSAECWQQPIR